ncbi:MAG: thioredoxin [Bdellovibrionales bacterium]|jgi:thioredoxin 1
MGENCKHITDAAFESDVLKASGLVLVDFWAEWCGPCRMLGPVLEEIAGEMAGKVTIVKMNVDQSPETPGKFGVRSIPTLVLFKDGQMVETKVGSIPKQALVAWLNEKAA